MSDVAAAASREKREKSDQRAQIVAIGKICAWTLVANIAVCAIAVGLILGFKDVRVEQKTVQTVTPPALKSWDDVVAAFGSPDTSPTPEQLGVPAGQYTQCGIWAFGEGIQLVACR